ncbi:MAG: MFS transporter [Bacteroidales bacterium]|nr:MFS transporter [Bacteroidales bacterium]MCF8334659.1 MFS transporter [Bacteroidales bacterium]
MDRLNLSQKRNFYIILSVTLLSVVGVATIIPAFPEMSEELNTSREKIGLLITVFTLPGATLAPLIGVAADRWGRKKVLIPALILFGITGTLCFFAREFEVILALRFFQGLGAACLGIINTTLIGDIFSGDQKARAMGYNSGALSVAAALFPAIGGLLATINWYYPFLIPALALVVAVLVYFYLDNPEPEEKPQLRDYFQNIIKSIFTKEAITLFLLCFTTFILLFGVIMTYLPIFLKDQFGLKSSEIGFLLSFLAVSTGIVASQLDRISRLLPMKFLIIFGFFTYLVGFLAIPYTDNIYSMLILLLIIGIGQGINVPTIFNILTSIAPLDHRGAFMSVNSMTIRAGQTVGPIFGGILFGLWGISWVFWSGAILASFFLLVVLLFIPSFAHSQT